MEKRFLSALGLVLVAACGGKVIWVGGDDGAGGTHAGSSSSTGISEDPAPSSSATGLVGDACDTYCSVPACNNGNPTGCLQDCLGTYTPGCEGEADAYEKCIVANLDPSNCTDTFGTCMAEASAYFACTGGYCSTTACEGSSPECKCDGFCFTNHVAVHCNESSDGTFACDCTLNDMVVGSCTNPGKDPCNLAFGCCSQFFGSSGLGEPP